MVVVGGEEERGGEIDNDEPCEGYLCVARSETNDASDAHKRR